MELSHRVHDGVNIKELKMSCLMKSSPGGSKYCQTNANKSYNDDKYQVLLKTKTTHEDVT